MAASGVLMLVGLSITLLRWRGEASQVTSVANEASPTSPVERQPQLRRSPPLQHASALRTSAPLPPGSLRAPFLPLAELPDNGHHFACFD